MAGVVTGAPSALLRLEGVGVFLAASAAYAQQGFSWWFYAALLLVPDLSMLGYIVGHKMGAAVYNAGHWYVPPLVCVAYGALAQVSTRLAVGLIWAAHIGFDRAIGAGLKYADGFRFSHLGRLGPDQSQNIGVLMEQAG